MVVPQLSPVLIANHTVEFYGAHNWPKCCLLWLSLPQLNLDKFHINAMPTTG